MLAAWHFHIEISSKCTLRCPRCARQEVPNGLVNTELELDFFKRNFTPEFVKSNVEKITFCGDDGDPVYAHDLVPVISYIKSIKPVEIVIITNGSYKKPEWWAELGAVLDQNDTVHFSLDGWNNDSNNQYRVNSDWDSIIAGIESLHLSSRCRTVWAAIAFKFNENQIPRMTSMAASLGFDAFQLTKSTKFGSIYPNYGQNDALEPSEKYVSSSHRFERDVTQISSRGINNYIPLVNIALFNAIPVQGVDHNVKPLCEIGNKGLYIDAQGRLFPCCWVANRYSHNSEWKDIATKFDLNQRTLTDAINDSFWSTVFKNFTWQECQTKCNANKVDEKYATDW
jgi:MoaA/NifB/PqqE/SkfB family radical SAM enzyme